MIVWIIFALVAVAALGAAALSVKGGGLIGIGRLNYSRLRELRERKSASGDPAERSALDAVIRQCEAVRSRWVLRESDLHLLENTRRLVEEIAAVYHPESKWPVAEAPIGRLLKTFLELKRDLLALTRRKGVWALTQFRLRHVFLLSRAWKKKEEWEKSAAGRTFVRYRMYFFLKWIYYLARCLDLSFWFMRMITYVFYDVVFKIFLVQWYLLAGESALRVYRERGGAAGVPDASVLEEFDSIGDPETFFDGDLPEAIRKIAEASRKKILFDAWTLEWRQARAIYFRLVEDVAWHYHPRAHPLYDAKLFNLLLGLARFAETVASLETKPVLNKFLDLRVSHILKIKETTDLLLDNPVMEQLKKYRFGKVAKYSALFFKTVLKKHPGVIFKQFAFDLAMEGGKRWLYLYLHDKVAVEANFVYRE